MNLHLACQSGPTYISLHTLAWLIDGVIEREHHYSETGEDIDASMLMDRGCGYPSVACAALWATFETELESALTAYHANGSAWGVGSMPTELVSELMCADGPYAVFMSLNGEGVGVYDYWVHDHKLLSDEDCKALMSYLEAKLSHFANCSGSGSLNEIHEVCAYRVSR
jgi:hypothetical protein